MLRFVKILISNRRSYRIWWRIELSPAKSFFSHKKDREQRFFQTHQQNISFFSKKQKKNKQKNQKQTNKQTKKTKTLYEITAIFVKLLAMRKKQVFGLTQSIVNMFHICIK